jgi:endonuclease/exonuclease/phosphatase family metal-dependent hydrolase
MIQIDGLSRRQLETAMKKGRMPFLNHLLHKEGYHLQTLYSGLPASTPAVQGELFYGVKGVVPAFSFMNRKTGRVARMFEGESIVDIQKKLAQQGQGLLEGGSSYANIYSGGAKESHFCPETFGWDHFIKASNPLAVAGVVFLHGFSLVRTSGLLVLETLLAVVDCIRGLFDGRDLWKEVKFVPTRVAISILLRDLVTIGAMFDVTRGLPIVHLNFIGYDEQAHRRGPSSNFAHWSLKGIDDSIKRLVHSARASSRRDYDVWIYSDHGQEEVIPYAVENGKTIHEAVKKILEPLGQLRSGSDRKRGEQFERSKWVGGSFLNWLVGEPDYTDQSPFVITAMGSLAHIYIPAQIEPDEQDKICKELVTEANVPLVLINARPNSVQAWTSAGKFELPRDKAGILGADHPFLEEAAHDLITLCNHADAGDIVLSGWRTDRPSISFPLEYGSHTGPGSEETRSFALLPVTAPVVRNAHDYLRPLDLREGALHALGRHPSSVKPRHRQPHKGNVPLRIMTYNVHRCLGMDGKISPSRIAKVIAHYDPDIVALQELDDRRPRTGEVNQAHHIARELEMEFHFHPSFQIAEERYGNAILSRYPLRVIHAGPLPGVRCPPPTPSELTAGSHIMRLLKNIHEPRGALWVAITVGDREVQLVNTHLGLRRGERLIQVNALLSSEWLGHPDCRSPVIFCGDFNAQPGSKVCRRIRQHFHDAQLLLNDHRPQRTFFGRFPVGRIDHVFVSPEITVLGVEVPRTSLTRIASDHLPLIVEAGVAIR